MYMDKLLVIITGPEKCGTTYLKYLIDSIPDITSGFETGLLLEQNFELAIPFCKWIHMGGAYWGVPKYINFFDTNLSFNDKYELLFNNKGLISTDNMEYHDIIHQNLIKKSKYIIDKTPAYFVNLPHIFKNIPNNIPVVITIKYFKDYYYSLCVKKKYVEDCDFDILINKNINTLLWLKYNRPSNVYLFLYNDILKPDFKNKLKEILSYKIDLTDVEISYENFVKKIENQIHCYSDWEPSNICFDLPLMFKNSETQYNILINETKINLD
jgi:hypothetical protein